MKSRLPTAHVSFFSIKDMFHVSATLLQKKHSRRRHHSLMPFTEDFPPRLTTYQVSNKHKVLCCSGRPWTASIWSAEIAGLDNERRIRRTRHCGTEHWRTGQWPGGSFCPLFWQIIGVKNRQFSYYCVTCTAPRDKKDCCFSVDLYSCCTAYNTAMLHKRKWVNDITEWCTRVILALPVRYIAASLFLDRRASTRHVPLYSRAAVSTYLLTTLCCRR